MVGLCKLLYRLLCLVAVPTILMVTPNASSPNAALHTEDSGPSASVTWTSIGPGGGGWLTTIAVAPSGTVYVGCDVGGVYRSTDHGEHWSIINNGLKNYNVNTIAVDPQTPSTLYAGTLGGVYKSIDGGDHWEAKRVGFPSINPWGFSAPIASLLVDPTTPDVVYAGIGNSRGDALGQGTIYKSLDGGETWFAVNSGVVGRIDAQALIYSIAVDPTNPNVLYAGTDKGFYKSTDGGVNWSPRNSGLPHTNVRKVVLHPNNPDVLYLTIYSPPGQSPWMGGVYKTIDGGENWTAKNSGLGSHVGQPGEDPHLTSNYREIIIDPTNPNILYVGDTSWWTPGVYKTTDGGETWVNTVTTDSRHPGWLEGQGPTVECLAVDPSTTQRVYFGNPMEMYRSDDGGGDWWQVYTNQVPPGSGWWQSRGLETTCLFDIAVDPTDSNRVYFGFFDVGFVKSADGGTTFRRTQEGLNYGGNTFDIVVDPENPNVIYATTGRWDVNQGDVAKSEDYGETWMVIGDETSGLPDAATWSLVLDPSSPVSSRTLYVTSYGYGVYKSTDGGASWSPVNTGLGNNGNLCIAELVINPLAPQILYLAVNTQSTEVCGSADRYGGIFKTTDGGTHWIATATVLPNARTLAVDPKNPEVLYAGVRDHWDDVNQRFFDGGVYKSTDGGMNWTQVLADPFVDEIVIHPHDPLIVYAGTTDHPYHDECTGNGVLRSVNGGLSWEPVNEGLGMLAIYALEIDPLYPNNLYAGTAGNGVFKGHAADVYRVYLPVTTRGYALDH